MLKIIRVTSSDQEVILRMDGRVTGPWVDLLRASAQAAVEEGKRLILDLENVYYLDCAGVGLIKNLMAGGTQLKNVPPFITEQIRKCKS